jgi:hypothetical protein
MSHYCRKSVEMAIVRVHIDMLLGEKWRQAIVWVHKDVMLM